MRHMAKTKPDWNLYPCSSPVESKEVYIPDDLRPFPEQGTYETREEYLARVTANLGELVDEALPNYTSYLPDGAMMRSGLLNEPEGIYRPLLPDASHLVSLVSFRVTTDDPGLASTAGAAPRNVLDLDIDALKESLVGEKRHVAILVIHQRLSRQLVLSNVGDAREIASEFVRVPAALST